MHKSLTIDPVWTLFLDRDGVLNRRLPDLYVTSVEEFEFLPGVLDSLAVLSKMFAHIIVVTNQQGIAKGLLTSQQLDTVHQYMEQKIVEAGGCIDAVYYCGELAFLPYNCRKPSPVMAYKALEDYPDIDFTKSLMVGDAISDVAFGQSLGMKTALIGEKLGYPDPEEKFIPDYLLHDLSSVLSILNLQPG